MNRTDEQFFLPYLTLRQAIGWIGLIMPLLVRLGAWAFEGIRSTNSISAYYYTGMRDVFVSTLVLIGALLACYRTPAKQDAWLGIITGLAAIGIALFPTFPVFAREILNKRPDTGITKCYMNSGILGYHFLFVGTFFALGFYLVLLRFRAFTPAIPTRQKILRNKVYQVCGLDHAGVIHCDRNSGASREEFVDLLARSRSRRLLRCGLDRQGSVRPPRQAGLIPRSR